ncbi:arsenate reductase (glutaredoxin) [Aestuariibacter halophilus]|uniref:Arsenate reductase n=1 Tax=Fluctibacter halophilus TaxID=226011 RepID=A0ABS8G8N3_9ALTE|nr:arsenate reductase (glutaredoxin) [Aestuariibacter halophilus]MCC2615571.1 arsenate reductase (glutaredoxin) [Aestuariibacter halophilus]
MSTLQILHNPRCSKSRQTLQLLQDNGHTPDIVEYLKTPLSINELSMLVEKLGINDVRQMMRTKEALYKALDLANPAHDNDSLLNVLAEHPALIERPIVINGEQAAIGRPPENVLALF